MSYKRLSKEARTELLHYLYLLIDEIQFSGTYQEMMAEKQDSHQDQDEQDFDDPLPFGKK